MEQKNKLNITQIIDKVADIFEIAVAFTLIIGIIFLFGQLLYKYIISSLSLTNFDINEFLSDILNIIIGIEFTRMLCRHTPETIIEVLLFATARQVIISHSSILDNLIGVVAVSILFIMKKYLIVEKPHDDPNFYIKKIIRKSNSESKNENK